MITIIICIQSNLPPNLSSGILAKCVNILALVGVCIGCKKGNTLIVMLVGDEKSTQQTDIEHAIDLSKKLKD